MKAIEVKIHNFRSICDATITLSDYNLLVGVNNSGKSTVLDAIRVFYGDGIKFSESTDFPKFGASDNESWVEIEFKPSPEEIDQLKDEYRSDSNTFRVRNYFRSDDSSNSGPYAYIDGKLSTDRFYGFRNVGQAKFGQIIYIPAVSKADDHTKLSGPSALRDLVSSVLSNVLQTSSAYQKLEQSFVTFEGNLKTEMTPDGLSLEVLENDISDELSEWGAGFRLTVNPVGVNDVVKALIGHEIFDVALNESQALSSYGQGFQRSVIYTLIRLAAHYTSRQPAKQKKDFSPEMVWILFEEPEAFLHPTQISALAHALKKLTVTGSTQVLLSTHSPQFASHNVRDLPAICRLHREDRVSTGFQITKSALKAIINDNQLDAHAWRNAGITVHEDDLTVDMESVKYALWLDPRRCGAFFAERVLLVEGPTETALLTYLHDLGKLPQCKGTFFLDTIGKYKVQYASIHETI